LRQKRILYILRKWVDRYFDTDFRGDPMLLETLTTFLVGPVKLHGLFSMAESILQYINQTQGLDPSSSSSSSSSSTTASSPRESTSSPQESFKLRDTFIGRRFGSNLKSMEFITLHPTEVMRQLTLIEYQMFQQIQPVDCFIYAVDKSSQFKVEPLIDRFNQVSQWVASEIVLSPNLKNRTTILRRFIRIASVCFLFFFDCFPSSSLF
jgi:hypothetical protein